MDWIGKFYLSVTDYLVLPCSVFAKNLNMTDKTGHSIFVFRNKTTVDCDIFSFENEEYSAQASSQIV